MAILCGIDLETTGLDPLADKIIEVAFVLWDTEVNAPLSMKSYFVSQPVTLSSEITGITGITQAMMGMGYPEEQIIEDFYFYHDIADYWVAHNAPFEHGFLFNLFRDCASKPIVQWIDTKEHIPGLQGKRLIHAAAEMGILNPFPHRALPDVLTMLTLLSKFDFQEVERYVLAPKTTLIANVSYENKDLAKNLGYGWVKRLWQKTVPDFEMDEEIQKAAAAGFTVKILELSHTHLTPS